MKVEFVNVPTVQLKYGTRSSYKYFFESLSDFVKKNNLNHLPWSFLSKYVFFGIQKYFVLIYIVIRYIYIYIDR